MIFLPWWCMAPWHSCALEFLHPSLLLQVRFLKNESLSDMHILYSFFIFLRKKKLEKEHLKNAYGELGFSGSNRGAGQMTNKFHLVGCFCSFVNQHPGCQQHCSEKGWGCVQAQGEERALWLTGDVCRGTDSFQKGAHRLYSPITNLGQGDNWGRRCCSSFLPTCCSSLRQ